MTPARLIRPLLACATTLVTSAGCAFHGVNSLPLPGTAGRGPGATTYHVQLANIGTLEPNSPVLIHDVIVGSIGSIKARNWHADVDISIKRGITVPANVIATVGQTSLLGSMHLALNPPPGTAATGRLAPGSTIPLRHSATAPSTEQTLSSLSLFINVGGATQIGDIIRNVDDALHGRETQIRDALTRLDTFLALFDRQRDKITATIDGLDRLSTTLAAQTDTIDHALHDIPPALDVLIRERPRLTAALNKLGAFSQITTRLVHDSQTDLVNNLRNLEPVLGALADIGPHLDAILAFATVFPLGQNTIDRAVRGDYLNLYAVVDLTLPRIKRTLLRGTRWEDLTAELVPAPGDPYYLNYTLDPLGGPLAPPPPPPPAPVPEGGGR
jgi:phospholipid/cholesterol/gamma-HCH transport system substrate-binding protein